MKGLWKLAALLLAVALIASLSCFLTSRLRSPAPPHPAEFHQWVHHQLHLTAEQDKALDAIEDQFASRKKISQNEIQQANTELAQAMQEDKTYSPRVVVAVEKIHHAQSDLEKITLEHIFAMKTVLTPEQFDQLLKLTADALNEPSSL